MPYSSEVVLRARNRLAQAKEDRESENRQHLAEAYAKVPRIKEIDMLLRRTMAQAAQAAFLQGSDGKELLEKARIQNLELQQERALLAYENFEEGYLDETPICEVCGGTGYIGATMCECLAELCRQEQKKEISILTGGKESFSQFRLDYYSDYTDAKYGASPRAIMERNFQSCKRYAMSFSPNAGNLLFIGGTGLGKTFLSACIARAVADRGYSVVYETAGHLFSKLEQAKFGGSEEARREIAKYNTCDLLILDDLGTEYISQLTISVLYELINTRMLCHRPTIYTSNIVDSSIFEARYTEKVASRILGSCQIFKFFGTDQRLKRGGKR